MKLYCISQSDNNDWDTYSDAIVAAESEADARTMHPNGQGRIPTGDSWTAYGWTNDPEQVIVKLIGTAIRGTKAGVILASFHAG